MKVKELISQLQKLNQNLEVVVAEYDLTDQTWAFAHVETVRKEAVCVGSKDKNFAYIYSGDWLDQDQ
jgi:hypothetical protein